MSFAFMPFYTGDYLRDTRHLTPMKHGVYMLLLMHCWDQRGPLPLDEQECAGIANCRSSDEIDSLRYILHRFFVRMEDGWYNKRMQSEVERSENISLSRSKAGRKGYKARVKQMLCKSQASASTPTPTTTTTTTTTPTPKPKGSPPVLKSSPPGVLEKGADARFPTPDRVDPEVWASYLEHRKAKRARMTDKIYEILKRDMAKMDDPNVAVERSIVNNWTGVFDRPMKTPSTSWDKWLAQGNEKEVTGERE